MAGTADRARPPKELCRPLTRSAPAQARENFPVNGLLGGRIGCLDPEQVIGPARHQQALPDLRVAQRRGLEPVQVVLRPAFQRDLDDGDRAALLGRDYQRRVASDHAGLLGAFELRLVVSHFACADELGHPANLAQLDNVRHLRALLPLAPSSLCNSGGVLLGPHFRHDLARPGVALIGVSPTPGQGEGSRPVVRLNARVIQLRAVPAGTAVGYGGTWRAPGPARLAPVAVGYADGWPRALGNKGSAYRNGVPLPVAGGLSMDSLTLDVSALPKDALRPGSAVELIGPHQSLDEVAAQCGTIPYEILTGLGRRFARLYTGGAPEAYVPDQRGE